MIRLQQAVNDMKFLSTLSLRRATFLFSGFWAYLFLSTLSLRRATHCIWILCRQHPDFYPRSPCGERRVVHVAQDPSPGRISIHALLAESDPAGNGGSGSITAISIHALLAESDTKDKKYKIKKAIFLSTLSLRRATKMKLLSQMTTDISIHALLAESDGCRIEHDAAVAYDFYPRSPCGERPCSARHRDTI